MKAEREAEREAGLKALWALVSLGWMWLQERHPEDEEEECEKTAGALVQQQQSLGGYASILQRLFS